MEKHYYCFFLLAICICLAGCHSCGQNTVNAKLAIEHRIDSLFKYPALQDSLMAYLEMYKTDTLDSSFRPIFRVYIYIDKHADTIVDIGHSLAYRTDLGEMYGIQTLGETQYNDERIIVQVRGVDRFPALNESLLHPSKTESVNILTQRPDMINHLSPITILPTSKVYRMVTKDSLLLINHYSLVPTYEATRY